MRGSLLALLLLLVFALAACQANATPTDLTIPTIELATPTVPATPTVRTASCADLDTAWGKDWVATMRVLDELMVIGLRCGEEPLLGKYYAAHVNYAVALEQSKQLNAAVEHYRAAFRIDSQRKEALSALIRLNALPEPTPPACSTQTAPRLSTVQPQTANRASFAVIKNNQLMVDGKRFQIRGVNYYPRNAPWRRFLPDADSAEMAAELRLIKQAGLNTLRVFLWYESLFECAPEAAIPNQAGFAKLDALLSLVRQQDLKLIVTLNDLPDLVYRPLYTDWARYDAQTAFVVRRYRNEPNILAWDLRNEGDLDYGAQMPNDARIKSADVTRWLAHVSALVRQNDPTHLLTAGWSGDPTATGPYVDFLSFHHWGDAKQLRTRIADYRRRSSKPLLLEEVGYHSWAQAPSDARDEAKQATLLADAVNGAERQRLLGWIVWAAFDLVPPSGQPGNFEYHFGLWRTDLTPKPALKSLPLR